MLPKYINAKGLSNLADRSKYSNAFWTSFWTPLPFKYKRAKPLSASEFPKFPDFWYNLKDF